MSVYGPCRTPEKKQHSNASLKINGIKAKKEEEERERGESYMKHFVFFIRSPHTLFPHLAASDLGWSISPPEGTDCFVLKSIFWQDIE